MKEQVNYIYRCRQLLHVACLYDRRRVAVEHPGVGCRAVDGHLTEHVLDPRVIVVDETKSGDVGAVVAEVVEIDGGDVLQSVSILERNITNKDGIN